MTTNFIAYLQGFVGRKNQGCGKKVLLVLLGFMMSVAALSPSSAQAAVNGGAITQLEFLQWMVQLVGDKGQFNANSKAEDYVNWAKIKGMNPSTGWQPGAQLSREAIAQVLVQLFQLNSKKYGGDYIRILEREGIKLPPEMTRKELVNLVNDFSFFELKFHRHGQSPHKHPNNGKGNGNQPPPPKNPNGNPHDGKPGHNGGHNKDLNKWW